MLKSFCRDSASLIKRAAAHRTATRPPARLIDIGKFHIKCAYLHTPESLAEEITAAGFTEVTVAGIEGPIGPWARLDPSLNEHALDIARATETNAGSSIHMLARGTKPGTA
jgi:hypothetical protein